MVDNIIYSLIIPYKNNWELLERCLDSIPERDDIQILVIDDCSRNLDINAVQLKHKKLEIIQLDRSYGAGYARNIGISRSKGKWLLFADADDYYCKENLNKLLNKYSEDNQVDIVYLNARIVDEKGCSSPYMSNKYITDYKSRRFYAEKNLRFGMWTPWSRMIKRKLVTVNNLKFEEIPIGNDLIFCLNCSKYAKVIAVEECILYYYYKPTSGSVTMGFYNIENLRSQIELTFRMNEFYRSVGYMYKFSHLRFYYLNTRKKGQYREEIRLVFKEIYKKNHYSLMRDLLNSVIFMFGKLLGNLFKENKKGLKFVWQYFLVL